MKRISGYITDELYDEIVDISKRDKRKFTPTIDLLLQQAVKERNRKKNANKIHIQNKSADSRKSNAGG
jgi:hypothetical protein